MKELTYGDPEDPWGDHQPKKIRANTPVQHKLLEAGQRHYFKTGEKKRIRQIEKGMAPYVSGSPVIPAYPEAFVLGLISWCHDENIKSGIIKYTVPKILTMLEDKDRRSRWLSRQSIAQPKEEDRGGY